MIKSYAKKYTELHGQTVVWRVFHNQYIKCQL